MKGDWSTTWWYLNQKAEAMDADSRFAETVLSHGELRVVPVLGPVSTSSHPAHLDPMDDYVCGALREWYGRDSAQKRNGRTLGKRKKRRGGARGAS